MFVEDALKKILSDSADVSALVDNRIIPGTLEQVTVYPAVAYRKFDEDREPTLDSPRTGPPVAQFVFFAVVKKGNYTYNGQTVSARRLASQVEKAIRARLQGFKDVVIVDALSPPEMMDVQGIFFVRSADTYDDRTETYQYASVYDVHFSDSD